MQRLSIFTLSASLAAAGVVFNGGSVRAAQDDAAKPAAADASADQAASKADKAADVTGTAAPAAQAVRPTHLPAGFKMKEKIDDPILIRKTLSSITEAAIKGKYDDVVERLADQDRNRVGKFDDDKRSELKDAQQRVRDAWKSKFNKEFDFDIDRDKLFAKVFIIQGEVEDPAVAAGNWPLPPSGDQGRVARAGREAGGGDAAAPLDAAQEAAANTAKAGKAAVGDDSKQDVADQKNANIEKGRDVAVAAFPGGHGLPNVRVSMIQEAGGYKVDLPNSISGDQLYQNLAQHLRQVADNADQWPADATEAQIALAHHVLAGVYGVQEKQEKDAKQPGEAAPGAPAEK